VAEVEAEGSSLANDIHDDSALEVTLRVREQAPAEVKRSTTRRSKTSQLSSSPGEREDSSACSRAVACKVPARRGTGKSKWSGTTGVVRKEMELLMNRRLRNRLRAFDSRYIRERTCQEVAREIAKVASPSSIMAGSHPLKTKRNALAEAGGDTPGKGSALKPMDDDSREVDVPFTVARWSSQRPEHPAAGLAQERWEAAPSLVSNEFVVFETRQAVCVSTIRLVLPCSDAGPRCCRVHYSRESAEGPWTDAWRFEVSREEAAFKTSHDYGRVVEEFKEMLTRSHGSLEDAWRLMLDLSGEGRLSYGDFSSAMYRLRTPAVARHALFENLHGLFDRLTGDSGELHLEDLLREDAGWPQAQWWRLTVINNWGSASRLQLGPVRLLARQHVRVGGLSHFRRKLGGSSGDHSFDHVSAFDLTELGLDTEVVMLRRLAKKHGLSCVMLEDLHQFFTQHDKDGSGAIKRQEFDELMSRLHGSKDAYDLPQGRLLSFWDQADLDGNGEITFEEFLAWFIRYFVTSDLDAIVASVKSSRGIVVGSFYSSFAKDRLGRFARTLSQRFSGSASKDAKLSQSRSVWT